MRLYLFIALLASSVLTVGCASMQRMTNSDGLTDKEREAKQDEAWAKEQSQRAQVLKAEQDRRDYLSNLKPNLTKTEIIEHVGRPERSAFLNGQYIDQFNDTESPMVLIFDQNERLVGWRPDADTINMREDRKFQKQLVDRRISADKEIARRQALSQALMNMSNQVKSTNCTSTRSGNQVYTNCN